MSKELDYIADIERENRALRSFLYCTAKSCNNCGKVKCENFQRQRIDCCGLWVSYKDYITDIENKIADLKANCDLAIEGRDVKIKELERENEQLKSIADFQQSSNMERHFEIQKLKKENAELSLELYESGGCRATKVFECGVVKELKEQLTKAKEIIKKLYKDCYSIADVEDLNLGLWEEDLNQAQQFIKEIERC